MTAEKDMASLSSPMVIGLKALGLMGNPMGRGGWSMLPVMSTRDTSKTT